LGGYSRQNGVSALGAFKTGQVHLECPSEVTEDCLAPPHLSQSFVTCEWVSHSFHPDASSLPYCQVQYMQISIKMVDFC
jgi:hypothetical protein